jgi:hypothetical protein
MTMRWTKLAAALLLAIFAPLQAGAQTSEMWTSADGALRFTPPAGWVRHTPPKNSDIAFAASKGTRGSGSPAVSCRLTIKVMAQAAPGTSQASLNARLQAGAASISLDAKRVSTKGGLTFIDGFLPMTPRILISMKAFYVSGGNLHDATMDCGSMNSGELSMDDLATARELFDTISVKQ